MKVQIKRTYVANDGTEFSSLNECKKYEKNTLTKQDLDFMKDFISHFLSHGEYFLEVLKSEAKRTKEDDPVHSSLCYKDYNKTRNKLNKLALVQKKIKSLR